ncbi:MAG: transposase [Gammaproteobacteria bacterium]|nr:transposase [Gammaproteobacteria bacterium]
MNTAERKTKINRSHELPISRQCKVLNISRLCDDLWDTYDLCINRKRVQRLMRIMGIRALYPGAKTTRPNLQHKVYPYLLRDLDINRVNQVWCTDLTYSAPCVKIFYIWSRSWTGIPGRCVMAIEKYPGCRPWQNDTRSGIL